MQPIIHVDTAEDNELYGCYQVSYSQCLGVIGYSVLPLFVIACILPLVYSFHYLSMACKVRIYLFVVQIMLHIWDWVHCFSYRAKILLVFIHMYYLTWSLFNYLWNVHKQKSVKVGDIFILKKKVFFEQCFWLFSFFRFFFLLLYIFISVCHILL